MSSKIDNFIAEIRDWPEFAAAAAQDPMWSTYLRAIVTVD
jgi:hypothetical protein